MTRTLTITAICLFGLMILVGCGGYDSEPSNDPAPPPPPVEPAAVSDDELSYRNEPLMDDSGTPKANFDAEDPGDSELVDRAFETAPPVIPHNTEGLLPITTDENTCAECHLPENAEDVGATSMPASHLYDMRRDKQLDDLNPANYYCTLCHAPQAQGGVLVENTFDPYFRAQELKASSNLLDTLNEGVE
jgi:cytochrome c-type protein NapB